MSAYTVDPEHVAASAAGITAAGTRIRSEVSALLAQLDALRDSWGGAASLGFAECLAQWHAAQAQVETALETMGTQLSHAASVYADAETRSAALFTGR